MGFEDLIPLNNEEKIQKGLDEGDSDKIGENQVFDIITGKKPGWQAIIYDLVHTEQLDPWDIDLVLLTRRYFEKIYELEEEDYYISSKVLLAASILLRIKSEILLNKHLKSIDEILFGKKEQKKQIFEKIEISEDELPVLIPRTPLPRAKKITLNELMSALNKAINTESRRIKKEVNLRRAKKMSQVDIPEFKRTDLKDRIKQFYAKVLTNINKKAVSPEKEFNKIGYLELIGTDNREEKLACFLPLLHLSNHKKFWLEQQGFLDEIWIYLYKYFKKNQDKFLEELEEDIETMKEELAFDRKNVELQEVEEGGFIEAVRKKEKKLSPEEIREQLIQEIQKEVQEAKLMKEKADTRAVIEDVEKEISEELNKEIKDLETKEKIDRITGFSDE